MIPYYLLLLLPDDEVGLVFEGAVASPVTLLGTWSNVIEIAGGNHRVLEITSSNHRSIDV
jgi:hypothetical protein